MALKRMTTDEFEDYIEEVRLAEGWDEDDPDLAAVVELLTGIMYIEAEGFIECELSPDGEIAVFPSL